MQVEREDVAIRWYSGERVRNTWVTYPRVGNNSSKGELIPHKTTTSTGVEVKGGLIHQSVWVHILPVGQEFVPQRFVSEATA